MFTVYSKPACTYCDQAKALLEQRGAKFKIVNLDVGQPKKATEMYISKAEFLNLIPSARTVPQILKMTDAGAQYIGGFLELQAYLTNSA